MIVGCPLIVMSVTDKGLLGIERFGIGAMGVFMLWACLKGVEMIKALRITNLYIDDRGVSIQKEGETAAFIPWSECKIRVALIVGPKGSESCYIYFMNKRFKDISYAYRDMLRYSNDFIMAESNEGLRNAVTQYVDRDKIVGLEDFLKGRPQKDWKPDEE